VSQWESELRHFFRRAGSMEGGSVPLPHQAVFRAGRGGERRTKAW